MKKMLMLLLCIGMLCLCGCAAQITEDSADSSFHLYCAGNLQSAPGGDAIATVNVEWEDLPQDDKQQQAVAILELLMGGCTDEDFLSPIPKGTVLQSCEIQNSVVWVDFSGTYGQLSGVDLTLADYCVTLNLTQISGIHAVRITVNGQELAYRDSNLFLASDVLLTSTEDVVRTIPVQLYFLNAEGKLAAEERFLTVYEGENRLGTVMDALLAGPEDESLLPVLPEGFSVLTVWQEDGICYLNLPAEDAALLPAERAAQRNTLQSIVNTLCSVEDITGVRFLQDGEAVPQMGSVDVSEPLLPKE